MAARKNLLQTFPIITAGNMTGNLTSLVTSIEYLDNVGMQFNFTGTPSGTFAVQVSADYEQDTYGNVTNSGNWISLSLNPVPTASGAANSLYLDLNQLSAPWIRSTWTSTATGVQTIHPVADSAGSLAGTYFLISDEASAHKYAIWFKVSGTGAAPTVTGYTNVEQDISTNDTAATIGAALATTIAALNSTNSFTASGTTTVTVTNKTAGPFTPMSDGLLTKATGFTFAVTTGNGSLNAFIVAKML